MRFIAGMLVLWSLGVGLGAVSVWAGFSRRGRGRAPRLVAWGGGRARDVQVGSWEDMARVCEQLIAAAALKTLRLMVGMPVLELPGSGWPNGPASVDIVTGGSTQEGVDIFVVSSSAGHVDVGGMTNIGRRDAK